jgi:hypothetical protein
VASPTTIARSEAQYPLCLCVHAHPGLNVLGLPFLHRIASSLVGADARFLAGHIARSASRPSV